MLKLIVMLKAADSVHKEGDGGIDGVGDGKDDGGGRHATTTTTTLQTVPM